MLWMLSGNGGVWFLEALSSGDRATYCFAGGEEMPCSGLRLLCAPQFSREALYSSLDTLTGERAELAIAAQFLGFLVRLRGCFRDRVIHRNVEGWQAEIDALGATSPGTREGFQHRPCPSFPVKGNSDFDACNFAVNCLTNSAYANPRFQTGKAGDTLARHISDKGAAMLWWASFILVIAVVAAIFGFGNIVAGATTIAIILFVIFLVIFIASLLFGWTRRRR